MLYPMSALALVTFTVLLINFFWRIHAVRSRRVHPKYFRVFQGHDDVPDYILAGGRHYANLFELPVLFYVVCLLAMILRLETPVLYQLAWMFVVVRILHAMIHMSYNNVFHRLAAFGFGVLILLGMWIVLLWEYSQIL